MTDMIGILLRVAEKLAELGGSLRKARRERRDRVAKYYEHLADVLHKAITAVRSGGVPNAEVQELVFHSQRLREIL